MRSLILCAIWCLRGIALAVGFIWAGLTSAQGDNFPELDLPASMSVEIVAKQMKMDTLNARVYAFRTNDTPDDLEAFFSRQWEHVARAQAEPWDVLSHRDGGFLITIQSRTDIGLQTQGFIAITDLFDAADENRSSPSLAFPLPRGTQVIQDLRSDDEGRKSRTIVLKSNLSVTEGLDFYRNHFQREGYEPVSRGALSRGSEGGAMLLNRGGETMDVTAVGQDAGSILTIVKRSN